MPKVHPIQNDFTAGILTPRFGARSDIEGYASGLSDCVNFIPLKQGPLTRRGGFGFIRTVNSTNARVVPMQLSPDTEIGESFVVLIDDNNISVIGATGLTSGKQILVNPQFANGLEPWNVSATGSAHVNWSTSGVTMVAGNNSGNDYCQVSQLVQIDPAKVNDDHTISYVVASNSGLVIRPVAKLRIGLNEGDDTIPVSSGKFNPAGASAVWVTVRADEAPSPTAFEEDEGFIETTDRVTLKSVSVAETGSTDITFPHGWSSDQVFAVSHAANPDTGDLYFTVPSSVPKQLTYVPSTDTWSFGQISFIAIPAEWVGDNYPSVMTFYQGRTYWGGFKTHPNRIWASKVKSPQTASYFDITQGVAADSGLDITITRVGKVQWLESIGNNLLIGTNYAEFLLSSEGGVITPDDFSFREQSANGGSSVKPIKAGSFIIYMSADGRKAYSTIYNWAGNSWRSRDLTFSAEHLTENAEISDIAYTKNPENIIWFSTTSSIIACTFDPSTEKVGWHRHETDGDVLSIASVQTKGKNSLFAVVRRVINNVAVTMLEIMDFNAEKYLDSHVVVESTNGTVTVPHLANRVVDLCVDRFVLSSIQLDASGIADVGYIGENIAVGLAFVSSMTTMRADFSHVSGSAMSLKKKYNSISIMVDRSSLPKINGQLPPERSVFTPMGEGEPVSSGVFTVINDKGFSIASTITIEQDLPLPTTILSIFGELNGTNL